MPQLVAPSPKAAKDLLEAIEEGTPFSECEDICGDTDCPEGCFVEPDGICQHGYESALLTAGLI